MEFPLAEGFHGVGVELFVEAAHEFDAVDGTIGANDGVEYDFAFHMFVN